MGNNSNMMVDDSDYLDSAAQYHSIGERVEEQLNDFSSTVTNCLPGLPAETAVALRLFIESLSGCSLNIFNGLLGDQSVESTQYMSEVEAADDSLYKG